MRRQLAVQCLHGYRMAIANFACQWISMAFRHGSPTWAESQQLGVVVNGIVLGYRSGTFLWQLLVAGRQSVKWRFIWRVWKCALFQKRFPQHMGGGGGALRTS